MRAHVLFTSSESVFSKSGHVDLDPVKIISIEFEKESTVLTNGVSPVSNRVIYYHFFWEHINTEMCESSVA